MSLELTEGDEARRRRNCTSTRPTWRWSKRQLQHRCSARLLPARPRLMQLDGRARQPDGGRDLVPRQERHRRSRAEAQRLDGLSAVHQLPEFHRLTRTSPRRCASSASASRDRARASARSRELLRLTPDAAAPAERAVRRPAAAHGDRARAASRIRDIILLDEPLANLDYKLREELRDELPKLFADRRCIVVYATTEPAEALLFSGNTATLHEGA